MSANFILTFPQKGTTLFISKKEHQRKDSDNNGTDTWQFVYQQ